MVKASDGDHSTPAIGLRKQDKLRHSRRPAEAVFRGWCRGSTLSGTSGIHSARPARNRKRRLRHGQGQLQNTPTQPLHRSVQGLFSRSTRSRPTTVSTKLWRRRSDKVQRMEPLHKIVEG